MADRDLSGRTLGEFVLREQIGAGGYGAVYRCDQPLLKRSAVVKVLHERHWRSPLAQERFLREAQLASRLDHPYAAHVYAFGIEPGVGEDDGLVWIAMELVQGVTLAAWLKAHGPMPLDQLVPYFEGVADVVHAAHDRGIIHRDLKPSNMMVIERGGRLFPKLLDFGIAKMRADGVGDAPGESEYGLADLDAKSAEADAADPGVVTAQLRPAQPPGEQTRTSTASSPRGGSDDLTRTGAAIGSSAYMSPEQWSNARDVGPATDIYALGVVVYQTLTGRLPFAAQHTHELYDQHLHAEPLPLGEDVPLELHRIIARALAKSAAERYGSVLELAAGLRAALRASEREQLRTSAQHWEDLGRPAGLLWSADLLADVTRRAGQDPARSLSGLERAFVAASQTRVRRLRWTRRALVALLIVGVLGALQYRATTRTQLERERHRVELTEVAMQQAELEQGRSALLHGEPDAALHLGRAYARGDRSPSTAFMLARALQPALAEQARFESTSGPMWSAAFSPDGQRIVTTDDRVAQLRDAKTGQTLHTFTHGDSVYEAVFNSDGSKLITAGGDGTVRVWDTARGALTLELRSGNVHPRYFAMVVSPGDKLVAAIDIKGDVTHVWDLATGDILGEVNNHDGSIYPALAFSADGRWLASTGGNVVQVFDTHTRRHAVTVPGPGIHRLAFDPTGPRLLTGSSTGDVWIWAIPSGAPIHHMRDIGDSVDAVAYSPDGQLVVAGCRDGAGLVWSTGTGQLRSQLNSRHSRITHVEFDRTSKLLLAASADGVVVADAALGMPVMTLDRSQKSVRVAHFDPSGRRVIGASSDGTARVWDATPPYRRWGSLPISDVCGVATTAQPAGRFLPLGCDHQPTRIWDTAQDRLLAELPSTSTVEGDFFSAFPAMSSAGDRAAIARGNTVEVYELPGGQLLRTIVHDAAVNTVAFARTGRDIVSGAVDGSVLVTRDGGSSLALPRAPAGIDVVELLPDGRVIAADAQRGLRLYDPSGALLADLQMPTRAMSLRAEGGRLVTIPLAPLTTTSTFGPPLLIDLDHHRVITQLDGHRGRVFSARWVVGQQVMTAGGDGTARLWDGATGQLRHTYEGSPRYLADATLTSDGLVVAGGADGVLRFWDESTERLMWTLPAHKSVVIGIHIENDSIVTRAFAGDLARWQIPPSQQVIRACEGKAGCWPRLR